VNSVAREFNALDGVELPCECGKGSNRSGSVAFPRMAGIGASLPLALASAKDRCPPKRSLVGTSRMRFEAPRLLVHTGPPSVSLGSGGVTTLLKGAGQRLAEALRRRSEVVADTCRHSPTCRGGGGMAAHGLQPMILCFSALRPRATALFE
jgi:hypothetical protein